MKEYGYRWKRKTLFALDLTGSPRILFCAFLQLSDWVGRSKLTLNDLSAASKLHRSTVKRIIPFLVLHKYLKISQHGSGKRPTFYQLSDITFQKSSGFTMNEPAKNSVVGSFDLSSPL